MIMRNIVAVIFLITLCMGPPTPGVTGTASAQQSNECYLQPPGGKPPPPGSKLKPALWGKSCGDGGHCDGCGTCCLPHQDTLNCQQISPCPQPRR
jgi:hypothetical protein